MATAATYRVDVHLTARAVRVGRRRIPLAGVVATDTGGAVGAAAGGILATAAHLVAPRRREIATALLDRAAELRPGRPLLHITGGPGVSVRLEGPRVRITVTQAAPPGFRARTMTATIPRLRRVRRPAIDRADDAALLRIPDPNGPVLEPIPFSDEGLPIVVLGFGGTATPPSLPAYREGRTGLISQFNGTDRHVERVSAPIELGDSGGPVVDASGRLAGVVSVKATDRQGGGGIVQIETLSNLLESAGFVPGTGHSDAFHDLMLHVWSLDIPGARVALTAPPLRPSDPLVAFERQRVAQLARARARLVPIEHTVSILRMVALTSLLAAAILIARLVRLASEGPPPQELPGQ